ncbi:hypothetical protein [Candidatus Hecatella orcuttiae]|jgi:hypothetical protein|uniref:hypothetical protein n=1 Tax=Candidatus Hecatella orcuttiae TaxID=1935119 RepID=UPI0028683091|nr:hypothetical protein [Candidatus Hecatella orcuttiae]
MATYEAEFEALLGHMKTVVEDIEQVHTTKQMIYKLKSDIIDLLRVVMSNAELDKVEIPPSAYGELPKIKGKEIESAVLDHSGIVVIKRKGKKEGEEEGEISFQDLREYHPEATIRLFNVVMPILREEISRRRKLHEKHLEALQAIKESLASVEKRRKL